MSVSFFIVNFIFGKFYSKKNYTNIKKWQQTINDSKLVYDAGMHKDIFIPAKD